MSMTIRDTVQRAINRSNLRTMVYSVLAILAGVLMFVGPGKFIPEMKKDIPGTSDYILRRFGEPQVLTADDLAKLTPDQLPLFNVTVTGEKAVDSGWTQESTTTMNGIQTSSSTSYFGFMLVGENILIFRTPHAIDENAVTYTGVLSAPAEVGVDVYNDFRSQYPDLKDSLLNLMLDPAYGELPWFMGLGIEVALVLGGLYGLGQALSRRNPENHPIMQRLARFGSTDTVLSDIDNDIAQAQPEQVDKLQLTRNWLISKNGSDLNFARTADVVWVYKHITQSRYSKTYAAHIVDRSGGVLSVPGKQKNVDAMVVAVLQRAPWAIAGYSKDVQNAWNKDRGGFLRTVDERLKQTAQPQ